MTDTPPDHSTDTDHAEELLALVRYGLGREIRLYPDALVFIAREEGEADRIPLANIRKLLLQPGERLPSKLVLLLELADGVTIIVGEGMTNVRDFRAFLPVLQATAPHITLDPPDMDEQLRQALANKRQTNMGCYGIFALVTLLVVLICVLGQVLSHH